VSVATVLGNDEFLDTDFLDWLETSDHLTPEQQLGT